MTEAGPNAQEAAKIVQRARGKAMAVIMQTIEGAELDELDEGLEDQLKTVVKTELNTFADRICALLPSLVDESVTLNALALEMISEIHHRLTQEE